MPTTRKQFEEFIDKVSAHPTYQENQQVFEVVGDHIKQFLLSADKNTDFTNILQSLKSKLQEVLSQIEEKNHPAGGEAQSLDTLFPNLNFRQQYENQHSVMKKIVEMELHNPTDFYSAPGPTALRYNGCVYPMPAWEEVEKILLKNREIIRVKSAQGFTELSIVPFGLPIRSLAETFKKTLKHLCEKDNIVNGDNQNVRFKKPTGGCVKIGQAWLEHKHFYPLFNVLHNKEDVIANTGPWQIHLMEKRPILAGHTTKPSEEEAINLQIPARQQIRLVNNMSPAEYTEVFDELTEEFLEDPSAEPHHNEQLIYPETYLWMQITSLLESNVLIDHIDTHTTSGTILAGCINPANGNVLCAGWNDAAIFNLYDIPNAKKVDYHGIRSTVPLK